MVFHVIGSFSAQLVVSSPLQPEGVRVHFPHEIVVEDEIRKVTLTSDRGIDMNFIELREQGDGSYSAVGVVTFTARLSFFYFRFSRVFCICNCWKTAQLLSFTAFYF